jgi:ElaB/YqjD/DUF883 family membrane-anchored ribosome-binding protein
MERTGFYTVILPNPGIFSRRASMADELDTLSNPQSTTSAKTATKPTATAAAKRQIKSKANELKGEAGGKAREAATQVKGKAAGLIDQLVQLVDDSARSIDDKVGPQYGDYARKASSALAGVAGSLNAKDVDELLNDARSFVRRNPAIAIGAATALGFIAVRAIRAGLTTQDERPAARGLDA